ncbi:MAG: EamA family transporter [Bacteroidota bacterium]|nr:EamA family transporter [Bacteroidota bacterium]
MLLFDYVLLITLAAIWGSSFIFMRVLAPALGPVATADMRLLIAGIALTLYLRLRNQRLDLVKNLKRYIIIGLLNSGIPFLLFSFAALYLPSSISVIINSLTPLFGVLFSILWLSEKMTAKKISGIALGIVGVIIIRGSGNLELNVMTTVAMAACVLATMLYGLASTYVKLHAKDIASSAVATGSQLVAGILLLPLIYFFPTRTELTITIALTTIAFALFCSAIAYVIFYRLLKNLGTTKALSVTFLIPVFGFIWGYIFLQEEITAIMIIGSVFVLSGIYFVTGNEYQKKIG